MPIAIRWPSSFLSRADYAGREGVASGLSALLMDRVSVRPEQAKIRRLPERILPRLRRSPGIDSVHRFHVSFQNAREALRAITSGAAQIAGAVGDHSGYGI